MDQSSLIRVVAAVVHNDGRYLIGERPVHKRHGGLWEFPGGKLEPGESVLDAAARELAEELGVEVTGVGAQLFTMHDPGSVFVIEFHEVMISGEPTPHEHSRLLWGTIAELLALPLAPSDYRFVHDRLSAQAGA